VVSGGELYRAIKGGATPQKIVYSGLGKERTRLNMPENGHPHVQRGVFQELQAITKWQAESEESADCHPSQPGYRSQNTPLYLNRVKQNKFGIDILRAPMAYRTASQLPNLKIVGIDCHIGSQLSRWSPLSRR